VRLKPRCPANWSLCKSSKTWFLYKLGKIYCENEIRLIDSPATRYIGKAENDDTEDSDLSTNWVESKTTNELREDQLKVPKLGFYTN
jgi:hypothetical protein